MECTKARDLNGDNIIRKRMLLNSDSWIFKQDLCFIFEWSSSSPSWWSCALIIKKEPIVLQFTRLIGNNCWRTVSIACIQHLHIHFDRSMIQTHDTGAQKGQEYKLEDSALPSAVFDITQLFPAVNIEGSNPHAFLLQSHFLLRWTLANKVYCQVYLNKNRNRGIRLGEPFTAERRLAAQGCHLPMSASFQ